MTTAYKLRTLMAVIIIVVLAAIPLKAQSVPQVELVGVIESMTLDGIVVNGLDVDIRAAELNTAITVDELVEVEGFLLLDGSILAREVNGVDDDVEVGEAELIGTLESFTDPHMFVNGQMIDVSGAQIKQGVTVGQMVKVHAYTVAANTWLAREVELYTPDDDVSDDSSDSSQLQAGEFEFTGTLEQIGQGFIVVSGQMVSTEGAEIKNQLMAGIRIRLHVRVQDGMMFAREIEYAFGRDDDNDNENSNTNTNSNDNANANSNDNANSNSNANANNNDNTSVDAAITADQAIAIVLSIYPNTTVTEIELKTMFGGTLVWDIETTHDIDIVIDAQTGVILSINMHDDDNGNNNTNANANSNNNSNDNSNANANSNFNSNDNDDDHDDDNDNNSGRDDNDDNSGHDDDDDDNSGRGSDDDDDD